MHSRRFHRHSLVLSTITILLVSACGRLPIAAPADPNPGVNLADPDVGGGAGQDTGPQTPIPTATATNEASPRLDEAARATAESRATTTGPSPTAAPSAAPTTESTMEPTATLPAPEATPVPVTPTPTATLENTNAGGEIVHVVQPGENLYRIGLQYGLSWVVIAQHNGIADANAIAVGQEIRIPPTPTPTIEASTGDTLHTIARRQLGAG